MVAPSGRTKEVVSFEAPSFSLHWRMVTGSVAPLELVEKASSCAGAIALKNCEIFNGVNSFKQTKVNNGGVQGAGR